MIDALSYLWMVQFKSKVSAGQHEKHNVIAAGAGDELSLGACNI